MEDLGPPIAYVALEEGAPVYDRDGERIGVVEDVLADFQLDIFEGVVVLTTPLPRKRLFADVDQIAALHERGVLLSVSREELRDLQERSATQSAGGQETPDGPLEARLRRAWERISGRR